MKGKPNLSIIVKEAKLLYDLDEQKGKGKQDPFTIVQLGAQKQKTKTATNQGKHPVWNETFQFLYDPKNPNLKVSVWDTDPQKKNSEEQLGEGILNLQNAETAPEWIVQVPLYKGTNDMGSLMLEFDFVGKQKPPRKEEQSEINSQPQSVQSRRSNKKQANKKEVDNFEYNTVDGDFQASELKKQINKIKDTEYTSTFSYLQESRLSSAIQMALNQVAESNPEDQIEFFADCLLKYNTQYNTKKLRPFKIQRDALTQDLKKLQQEYLEEERLNDTYFDEIGKAEREYELLVKQIEKLNKLNRDQNQGPVTTESQGLDGKIEFSVKKTLNDFLLNQSKKDSLEEIQQRELNRCNTKAIKQITMAPRLTEEQQLAEIQQYENGYYVTLQNQGNSMQVKVPGNIKTFQELHQIVKSCFMAEEKDIFYTDQLGNLLQFHMDVLDELYPSIYELLKNYEPTVGVQIIKYSKPKYKEKDEQQYKLNTYQDEILHTEVFPEGLSKVWRVTKRVQQKVNWSIYLGYLNKLKYFFESCLFIMLLILYVLSQINSVIFVTNTQLLSVFSNNFQIPRSFLNPLENISTIINTTLANPLLDYPPIATYPLSSGLLIQTLVQEEQLETCSILNSKQKQMFVKKNESCLNFGRSLTDDLDGNFTYDQIDPSKYNSYYGGYVWELNLQNSINFTSNLDLIYQENWTRYNIKQSQFILNYYNSPSQRLVQITITTLYLFNDVMYIMSYSHQ